jgi:hypothetical protein
MDVRKNGAARWFASAPIEEEEPVIGQVATETRELAVNSVVEVRGDTLMVNVKNRNRSSMFVPTMKIPLDHVLGAKADPEIERKLWKRWVLRSSTSGTYHGPDREVRFYNPRHGLAHKAIVIRLRGEGYERLVVEVEDPEGVVAQIDEAVGASLLALAVA